jgi:hypothetical protein
MKLTSYQQKAEDLTRAIRSFRSSDQTVDDYQHLILAAAAALRQGDGLGGRDLRSAIEKGVG